MVTESIIDEVVEGVAVAVVGEPVVGGREFLEALCRHAGEVSGELGVLGEDHGAASHEAVDQRFLPHRRNHSRSANTARSSPKMKNENEKNVFRFVLERERERVRERVMNKMTNEGRRWPFCCTCLVKRY